MGEISRSVNSNIEATNENTRKIFSLEGQVASLEEANSLQSNQLEEMRVAKEESEEKFRKKIEELEE